MSIKIVKQEKRDEQGDELYTAEVTTPQGTWRSPDPLPSFELEGMLFGMRCDIWEIKHAFQEVGVVHAPGATYDYVARKTRPFLQAALAGEREVPEQEPTAEAWLAVALSNNEGLRSLREVIGIADAIEHAIPDYDEISWAFLRLRRRGWLAVEGEMYDLTPEGRRAITEIVDRGETFWRDWSYEQWKKKGRPKLPKRTSPIKKLKDWISENPPPGDE
jgi:hypothetical protein